MCQKQDWTEPFGLDIALHMDTEDNEDNAAQSLSPNTLLPVVIFS